MKRGLCALVPVKPLAAAKQRLAPLLSNAERAALARAMFQDVLAALAASPGLGRLVVLTADPEAAALARRAGAEVMAEGAPAGLVGALTRAARALASDPDGMLVIPADVPLVAPPDIAAIVRAHQGGRAVTLVAAARDGGTNALACSPPDVLPFCFGTDSFRRHVQAAQAAGIRPSVLDLPRLAQDIDTAADLVRLVAGPLPAATAAFVDAAGLTARLAAAPGPRHRHIAEGTVQDAGTRNRGCGGLHA